MKFRKHLLLTIALSTVLFSVFFMDKPASSEVTPWSIMMTGLLDTPANFTYNEMEGFPMVSEVALMQCVVLKPRELSNWTGVPLFYLLTKTGVKPTAKGVMFYASDNYSSGLDIERAMHPTTLIALKANGTILSEDGGYPYRLVVPCKKGYNWVRWITKIEIVDYEPPAADSWPNCTFPPTTPPSQDLNVPTGSTNYNITVVSNSTVDHLNFDKVGKKIRMDLSVAADSTEYCYIMIPIQLLWCDNPLQWQCLENNTPITDKRVVESTNYTYIILSYGLGTKEISIKGVHMMPELHTLGNDPVVDFTLFQGKLYAVSSNRLYEYDGTNWTVIQTLAYMNSLENFESLLYVGGKGGLYSFDGATVHMIFPVSSYIRALGVFNNTLYAGTFLGKSPKLYYCDGLAEDPLNWHEDTGFSTLLNASGPFGSVDSFAVDNNKLYVSCGKRVYCFNGTDWSIANISYEYAEAYLSMVVYNGKLYLGTRDTPTRYPAYLGGSGFSGTIVEFDGTNWTTLLGHDRWIYSLQVYNETLYVGTVDKIYSYDGTEWNVAFNAQGGACYVVSLVTLSEKLYVGMGNGCVRIES
jgi:hypothetical protein